RRERLGRARTTRERTDVTRALTADATRLAGIYLADDLRIAIEAIDPVDALASLEATHPILLLPVRLETRFKQAGAQWRLLVRIYPDQIHEDEHEPRLTDAERAAGTTYWSRTG